MEKIPAMCEHCDCWGQFGIYSYKNCIGKKHWLRDKNAVGLDGTINNSIVTTQPEMRRKAKIGVKNSNANKTDTE